MDQAFLQNNYRFMLAMAPEADVKHLNLEEEDEEGEAGWAEVALM